MLLLTLRENMILPPLAKWSTISLWITTIARGCIVFNRRCLCLFLAILRLQRSLLNMFLITTIFVIFVFINNINNGRFGRLVHNRWFIATSPTWTIVQIVFNLGILAKCHITSSNDLLGLERHEPVRLGTFTISKKHTFCCLGLKFGSLRIGYLCKCDASKCAHVLHAGWPPTPRLLWCHVLNRTRRASVACVHRSHHRFRPKVQTQILCMQHTPCHFHNCSICTLCNSVLLWCIWRCGLSSNVFYLQ